MERKGKANEGVKSAEGALAAPEFDRLIRIDEVMRQTALSRTQVYERMKVDLPKPVKLGHRMVAWSERAIQAWVASKIHQAAARRIAA